MYVPFNILNILYSLPLHVIILLVVNTHTANKISKYNLQKSIAPSIIYIYISMHVLILRECISFIFPVPKIICFGCVRVCVKFVCFVRRTNIWKCSFSKSTLISTFKIVFFLYFYFESLQQILVLQSQNILIYKTENKRYKCWKITNVDF